MKNLIKNIGVSILLLLISLQITLAFVSIDVEEANTVGRLVGKTPYDIMHQLDVDELNLNHATYLDDPQMRFFDDDYQEKQHVREFSTIKDRFNNYEIYSQYASDETHDYWDYISFDSYMGDFESNELLVIKADKGDINRSFSGPLVHKKFKNMGQWKEDFMEHYPLLFYNTPYGGVSLPNHKSPVTELTRYSTIIAPTYDDTSDAYLKAFMCNLGEYSTLGETLMNTRHNYRINPKARPFDAEMESQYYLLYGNPLTELTFPKSYALSTDFMVYCQDWLERITIMDVIERRFWDVILQDFSIQSADRSLSDSIDLNYSVINNGDFSLIILNGSDNFYSEGELVLPYVNLNYEFPINTILRKPNILFSNPVILNVSNLPSWEDEYVPRSCDDKELNHSFTTKIIYSQETKIQNININPIKIRDCDSGIFELYQNIVVDMDYSPSSPVYFNHIQYPEKLLLNKEFNLTVTFGYVDNTIMDGELELYEDEVLIFQKELNSSIPIITFPIISVNEEAITKYQLRYVEDNQTLTESEFEIETRVLDYILDIPETVSGNSLNVTFKVYNYKDQAVSLDVYDNLLYDDIKLYGSFNSYNIQPGLNEIIYTYDGLSKSDQQYGLHLDLKYENKRESLTGMIVTNHKPLLNNVNGIEIRAGDQINLNLQATDLDGDSLTYSISDPIGDDGIWETTQGDEGEYNITLSVTDGLANDTKIMRLSVNDYNNIPILLDVSNISVSEFGIVSVILYAEDPDGDTLNYSVDGFEQIDDNWFEWYTEIGDRGNHTFNYSVTDGIDTVTKSFTVEVIKAENRPVMYPIRDITVLEGEQVSVDVQAFDPEQDPLTYSINSNLFTQSNNTFTWLTSSGDNGEYNFSVDVTDGVYSVSDNFTVTVNEAQKFVDTFTEGSRLNFTFTDAQPTQTVYIKVLKNVHVTSASFKVNK